MTDAGAVATLQEPCKKYTRLGYERIGPASEKQNLLLAVDLVNRQQKNVGGLQAGVSRGAGKSQCA
jgi:hypothetical protein